MAQETEATVTGTVTEANTEQPLPGVNIVVQGTTIGATTGADGGYELNVPSLGGTLVFSFVGYQTREVPINGRTTIDISLEPTAVEAGEVVVTAFGSQQRTEVTGSIASVDAEDVNQISESSLDKALQGKVPGLQMTQGAGGPASRSRILIRGIGSIQAGTEPLVVIDGMPVSGPQQSFGGIDQEINPLSMVNPNDVQSIEVLKDAAATALYGSRGSNGVILITTKEGDAQGQLSLNYSTGTSSPTEVYDLVGTQRWLELVDLARSNNPNNLDPYNPATDYDFRDPANALTRSEIEDINTDWFDQILRTGQYHNVNFSVGGGNQQGSNYFVSANYRTDEGFLVGNNMNRFITRANVDLQPVENLTTGIRSNLSYLRQEEVPVSGGGPGGNDQVANGNWNQAVSSALPWLPVRRNGEFFDRLSGNNLAATLHDDWYNAWSRNLRALGKLYVDYQIPSFEELTIHAEGSVDYRINKSLRSSTANLRPLDSPYGRESQSLAWDYNYNAYGTYQNSFLDDHEVKVTAGAEAKHEHGESTFIEALNRTATDEYIGSPGGTNINRIQSDRAEETRFLGYFTRLNYNYQGRYLAQFSFRRDGSSKFGPDRRVGNFPAGALGWVISEESFMDEIEPVNFLKVRASYGLTGNADIPVGVTENGFSGWKRYGTTPIGYYQTNIGSQDVGWETTVSTDIALEYGLFQDRISGSINWYRQDVNEMLLASPIPQSNGAPSSIWANIGDMRNQGWEFQIESRNITQGEFTWNTNFNFTLNSNEVLELTPFLSRNNSGLLQGMTNTRIGRRIGTYYVAASAGINPETGYEMIKEVDDDPFLVNENGEFVDRQGNVVSEGNRVKNPNYLDFTGETIPATQSNVGNNRALLEEKTGIPTYYGGLTNSFSYGGVNLSFTFNFQGGNYIYGGAMQSLTSIGGNISEEYLGNYWTENNTDAKYPKPSWNSQYEVDGEVQSFSSQTTRYLYKGDFLRLRRVRLGYNVPQSLIDPLNMNQLQVYVSGTNLWTYAPHYPGLDPEVTSFGNAQERNLNPGVAGTGFRPPSRQFTVGVNLGF